MKKAAAFCLVVVLMLALFAGNALAYMDYTGEIAFTGDMSGAYAVMLFDENSGMILCQKNIDEPIEPASTTKILTLLLALENGDMNEVVTVSANAASQIGSTLDPKLKEGEQVVFKDLINGMMLASGNEAAMAVAETVSPDGTMEGFVTMMNAKVQELDMTHTTFTTPHGRHDENHITTARDMAILTSYALQNPEFVQIVGQETYTMPPTNMCTTERVVQNTNKLLRTDTEYYYSYADGIKTGSTPYAGDCLVSSASKDGMNLVCLIYKTAENDPLRWTLSKDLYEWGFSNFTTVDAATLIDSAGPVQATVENAAAGDSGAIEFAVPDTNGTYITLDKSVADAIANGTDSVVAETTLGGTLQAPIAEGDVLGEVTYKIKSTGQVIYQGSLIAPRDVAVAGDEPGESVAAPTETQTPPPDDQKDDPGIWLWILIAAAAIAVAVIVLLIVNQSKRKRARTRRSQYNYRARK